MKRSLAAFLSCTILFNGFCGILFSKCTTLIMDMFQIEIFVDGISEHPVFTRCLFAQFGGLLPLDAVNVILRRILCLKLLFVRFFTFALEPLAGPLPHFEQPQIGHNNYGTQTSLSFTKGRRTFYAASQTTKQWNILKEDCSLFIIHIAAILNFISNGFSRIDCLFIPSEVGRHVS